MFLTSGSNYYSVPLTDIIINCKSGMRIPNPNIQFKLLSISDLNKIDLMTASKINDEEIYEEICGKCILNILHFPQEVIDFDNSPAGIVEHIGGKILYHSRQVVTDLPKSFELFSTTVTVFDQIYAFVSRYTCTPIKEVREYPIDFLLREYSILQASFPNEVLPISSEEDQVSKVGG